MDLLFKRYASPILIISHMMQVNRFSSFVSEFIEINVETENESKLWELYLHHTFLEQSFNDFKKSVIKEKTKDINKEELEATIINSKKLLNDFIPQ